MSRRLLLWTAAGLAAVATVGLVDFGTGSQLGMSSFYAIPVFLVTWSLGVAAGCVVAGASVIAWTVVQLLDVAHGAAAVVAWNACVRASFFGAVVALAVAKRRLVAVQREALTDFLTGVHNRQGFMEQAERELERARRFGRGLTVVYLDCDNFKSINDTMGHSIGNQLLQTVAVLLQTTVRRVDVVGRLGGDEFALLIVEAAPAEVREILTRVIERLRAGMRRRRWPVSFSAGAFTLAPADLELSVDTLLRRADDLMYLAKRAGKDRLEYEPGT